MKRFIAIIFVLILTGCIEAPVNEKGFIKVASFNIQVFGQSKLDKPEVMDVIARITREFDVVAIQEVRSKEQNVIPELLELVNSGTFQYDYVISERLGRSTSKEQYAIVYNKNTVSCDKNSAESFKDKNDVFEREPHIVFCKSGNFDFLIVNNHIKPEDAFVELSYLNSLINYMYDFSPEEDILVLGDMNADGTYLDESKLNEILPQWVQLIDNSEDSTVAISSNTYDRIMTRTTTSEVEYMGQSGVFRWDLQYGIADLNFVKEVSDHYPVYAEFRTDLADDD